ncbi:MAG: 4Fe-4S binding protein [Spirochaetes bacterium]|jgi:ferredoxin|nr:4Fe-4S binding protein [Spirochaetota bacterium]
MTTRKYLLQFPEKAVGKPLIYHLAKDYDLMVNIFRAKIDPDDTGYMVLDISGTDENIKRAALFFKENGIIINEKMNGLTWDKERCVSCGNCITHCPSNALAITDRSTMEVSFNDEKCIECMNCISHCPFNACSSIFNNTK